ncbi:MAG: sugar O-acetyltransferase [Lachnospiraceae bacterium]|nr:sugar O-acetyltransferase [Lachnospiraceae bacterium]
MTEKEKMLSGMIYNCSDPELASLRLKAHRLSKEFNACDEDDTERIAPIIAQLVPGGSGVILTAPVFFDYGIFTNFGSGCYANANFTVLDCAPVKIGSNVFFGPNCSLLTPVHPMLSDERRMRRSADGTIYDLEYARPITIGNDCWIAGCVTICGGVTIGEGCVIGAGSVVTRDIPSGVFAAGNPCRPIRKITEADKIITE